MSNDYTRYPNHPLHKVPTEAIDAARAEMRVMIDELVNPEMAEPVADAILIAVAPWLQERHVMSTAIERVEERITGPWRVVSEGWHVNKVPTIVNGFGRAVETSDLTIRTRVERQPVWEFVGYEERTVES